MSEMILKTAEMINKPHNSLRKYQYPDFTVLKPLLVEVHRADHVAMIMD